MANADSLLQMKEENSFPQQIAIFFWYASIFRTCVGIAWFLINYVCLFYRTCLTIHEQQSILKMIVSFFPLILSLFHGCILYAISRFVENVHMQ